MGGAFRLQQVLDHKRQQEETKTRELATLAAEQRRTRDELRALRDREAAQLQALQDVASGGTLDPRRLDAALGYLDVIEASIAQQAELVTAIEERVCEGRGELIAILKEKQLLEKLEQQHAAERRDEENRRENGQFDEIAAQRYIRGAAAEAEEAS